MTKTKIIVMAAALALSAASARAQTTGSAAAPSAGSSGKVFVGVNAGGQVQTHTFASGFELPVYNQTAAMNTSTGIDGGPIFDLNAGYRIMRRVGVAAGFSTFSVTGATNAVALVPNPSFFNRAATVTVPEQGAKRTERSVYVQVVGFYDVTDKIEVSAFAGPSFLNATQELITGFTVPTGTQDVVVTSEKQSGSSVGLIAGVDASYLLTSKIGVGGFIRYNGGSVDLDAVDNLKVGGLQIGAGIRIRY
jgi:opacity protein-like surface antigen